MTKTNKTALENIKKNPTILVYILLVAMAIMALDNWLESDDTVESPFQLRTLEDVQRDFPFGTPDQILEQSKQSFWWSFGQAVNGAGPFIDN